MFRIVVVDGTGAENIVMNTRFRNVIGTTGERYIHGRGSFFFSLFWY